MDKVFVDPPIAEILSLLTSQGLTTEDLSERGEMCFFGFGQPGCVRGVVGLEVHGRFGLLRSLAVSKDFQRKGTATILLNALEIHAHKVGITELYLLTETAQIYFSHRGFSVIPRELVPREIRETHQFSSLCPDSATLMRKRL